MSRFPSTQYEMAFFQLGDKVITRETSLELTDISDYKFSRGTIEPEYLREANKRCSYIRFNGIACTQVRSGRSAMSSAVSIDRSR